MGKVVGYRHGKYIPAKTVMVSGGKGKGKPKVKDKGKPKGKDKGKPKGKGKGKPKGKDKGKPKGKGKGKGKPKGKGKGKPKPGKPGKKPGQKPGKFPSSVVTMLPKFAGSWNAKFPKSHFKFVISHGKITIPGAHIFRHPTLRVSTNKKFPSSAGWLMFKYSYTVFYIRFTSHGIKVVEYYGGKYTPAKTVSKGKGEPKGKGKGKPKDKGKGKPKGKGKG